MGNAASEVLVCVDEMSRNTVDEVLKGAASKVARYTLVLWKNR